MSVANIEKDYCIQNFGDTAVDLRTNACVSQDHVLIELTQGGLKGSTEGSESYEEDPYLVVNPNYLLED